MRQREVDREKFPTERNGRFISELQVLRSAAGWYIGRMCWCTDLGGYEDAESRESGYYGSEEEAQAELDAMTFEVRDCIENQFAYETGGLPHPRPN